MNEDGLAGASEGALELPDATRKSLAGRTALVTGGAGFIGSHIVDALRACEANVRVLDNFSTGFRHNLDHVADDAGVTVIDGDASDADAVDAAVAGVDYVFHQSAMASVPRSIREPALCHAWCTTSTVELLHAASRHGVRRLVLASTSAAYGNSSFVSKRETDPVDPLSPYAASKLAAEMHCHAFAESFGVASTILRYFNVFGPRQDPASEYSAVIPRFVSMILEGRPPVIYGDGQQSRDFVYVGDVARANLMAAALPLASGGEGGDSSSWKEEQRCLGPLNVGRGQSTTLLELLDTLRELLGRDITPIHEPARVGDVRDSLADINPIRRTLGFEPTVSVREGLRRGIDYYRDAVTAG